jgi:hypothetical protein
LAPSAVSEAPNGARFLDRLAEVERLADAGEHERASLRLYLSKGLCSPLPIEDFRAAFRRRDRVRLRELTDPLPGPYTLSRRRHRAPVDG